jgi:hypothetical protein
MVYRQAELLPRGVETGNAIASFLQFAFQFLPIRRAPGVEIRPFKNPLQPNDFFFCRENGRSSVKRKRHK